MELKVQKNKYEGININALLFMADMPIEIPQNNMNDVWQEIFTRYFNDRSFNLYAHIRKLNKTIKYLYFSIAMKYELQKEFTNIPVNHVEDFIVLILEFIEFVDKKVLSNENLTVEWTLHEFYGMKDMLEKVRKAKISDTNLKQKINLFIDKINKAREDTLKKQKENENKALMTIEKKELMQETLQHLNISVSKLTKSKLCECIQQIHIYYPEDRTKLIKRMIKYYPKDFIYEFPYIAFDYYLDNPDPEIDMNIIINRMDRVYSKPKLDCHSKDKNFILSWIRKLPTCTDIIYDRYRYMLFSKHSGDNPDKAVMMEELNRFNSTLIKYSNKNLSEILNAPQVKTEIFNYNICGDIDVVPPALKWNGYEFAFEEDKYPYQSFELFEYYLYLKKLVNNNLFLYNGWITKENGINFYFDVDTNVIWNFCKFYETITLDKEGIEICLKNKAKYNHFLATIMQYKSCHDCWTTDELKLMFKDYYQALTKEVSIFSYSGWFKHPNEHKAKYFNEILNFYDFSKEDELKDFFNMKWDWDSFIHQNREWPMDENAINVLYDLLIKYRPYEVKLIEEYMLLKEESFETTHTFEDFEHLDAYTRLILEQNGVNTSHIEKTTGIKIKLNLKEMIVPIDKASKYYLFKYFEKNYS